MVGKGSASHTVMGSLKKIKNLCQSSQDSNMSLNVRDFPGFFFLNFFFNFGSYSVDVVYNHP